MLAYIIKRGLKNLKLGEVYDEWSHLLAESGFIHPMWDQEDCEFVKNTLSSKQMVVDILQEIISFKRQGVLFTYELLGLNHSDIYDVYNCSRVTDNILSGGLEEPWMGWDRQIDSVSEEGQSASSFSTNDDRNGNSKYVF